MFETVALNMPAIFVLVYGAIAFFMPRFRWVGLIVAVSASLNILLQIHLEHTAQELPYGLVVVLFSCMDYVTAVLMLKVSAVTINGHYFGSEGAEMQAFILSLFIVFNGVLFLDYNVFDYALYSSYIPVIFLLNIAQMTLLGRDIHASTSRNSNRLRIGPPWDTVRTFNIRHSGAGYSRGHKKVSQGAR